MPRRAKPARLWLRPAAGDREKTWIILDGGRQYSTGCCEDDRAEAEKRLVEHIGAKHEPAAKRKCHVDQTLISDVLNVYLMEVVPQGASVARATARVERLLDWWGMRTLSEVSPLTCRAYEKHRATAERQVKTRRKKDGTQTVLTVKPKTANSGGGARRDLEELRAAINHHARRDLHTGVVDVLLPKKGKPRPKYLTRDEVARLLWVCWRHKREQVPPRGPRKGQTIASQGFHDLRHLARFVLMGVYSGSRTAPILRASLRAAAGRAFLDLEAGLYFRLPEDVEEADNKKSPTSRISPRLMAHLRRWRDKGVIAQFVVEWNGAPVKSIKTAWKTATTLAGIEDATPHTLRHTAVTWLKQQGYSSFAVGGFTGMSEEMVERVYGHHDPAFQKDIAGGIGYRKRA